MDGAVSKLVRQTLDYKPLLDRLGSRRDLRLRMNQMNSGDRNDKKDFQKNIWLSKRIKSLLLPILNMMGFSKMFMRWGFQADVEEMILFQTEGNTFSAIATYRIRFIQKDLKL